MPSPLHECFLAFVRRDIEYQLSDIQGGLDPAVQTAQGIRCAGSPDLIMADGGKHTPDLAFRHIDALYPGVIIETAYSQSRKRKGKDLARLAGRYIVGSFGQINRVIGLSARYPDGSRGTITVWGPVWTTTDQGRQRMEVMELVGPNVCRSRIHVLITASLNDKGLSAR